MLPPQAASPEPDLQPPNRSASDSPAEPALLEMRQITKSFGANTVLRAVSLAVRPGEVRALVGQNGAGKSTLMKVLSGLYPDHGGSVWLAGERADLSSPRRALGHGIAVIQQEFSLVPQMSVADNIMLGREPGRLGPVFRPSDKRLRSLAQAELTAWGLTLPLDRPVSELSVAGQQMVEIVKALARRARLLVMDEPTARLSAPERERLFRIIHQLACNGVGVIYISHHMEEVFRVAQTVTVLRDGRVVADERCADLDPTRLSALMLGRELHAEVEARHDENARASTAGPALHAAGLTLEPYFRNITVSLYPGEVVAITGLVGSGRSSLVQTLTGAIKGFTGRLELLGNTYRPRNPNEAVKRGLIYVPEDRKRQGLVLCRSASENMITAAVGTTLTRVGFVRRGKAHGLVHQYIASLDVSPPRPNLLAGNFSGGNQQKIVLARALMVDPKVLLLDQPTAGVDIGTKAEIHRLIRRLAADGRAVLVVSDDVEEVLAVSDLVIVMHRGEVTTTRATRDIGHGELLELITRATRSQT